MKVLITGGCGFIGANAAARFLTRGENVAIIDNLSVPGSKENLRWLVGLGLKDFAKIAVSDREKVEEFARTRPPFDLILHLAPGDDPNGVASNPPAHFHSIVRGTFCLLEILREYWKEAIFILTSSYLVMEMEGKEAKPSSTERPIAKPFPSLFSTFRRTAEMMALSYGSTFGLKTIVFRLSPIYGSREWEHAQDSMGAFLSKAVKGEPVAFPGGPDRQIDPLFAEDLLDLFETAATHGAEVKGRIYNVGGGKKQAISMEGLRSLMEKVTRGQVTATFDETSHSYVADLSQVEEDLLWSPKTSLEKGIREVLSWLDTKKSESP